MSRLNGRPRALRVTIPTWLVAIVATALGANATAQAQNDIIFQDGFDGSAVVAGAISPDPGFTGSDPVLKVGSDGVTHLLYTALDFSNPDITQPVRYGECAANCSNVDNWQFATLGNAGAVGLGGGARLALDANGHPRVLWYSQASVAGASAYVYGKCDSHCTVLANWSLAPIASYANGLAFPLTDDGFVLDPFGHPRFIFQDASTGVQYAWCDNACTVASQWSAIAINLGTDADVAFTATGQPRALFTTIDTTTFGEDLVFAKCDAGCGSATNWTVTGLVQLTSNITSVPHAFALTAQGQPRVAYYVNNGLALAGCDGNCSTATNWGGGMTTLPTHGGYKGVALALDGGNYPYLAYGGSPDGVSDDTANVAVCTANCYTSAPTWQSLVIESTTDIAIPPSDPCGTGDSFWQLGPEPSLAVDSMAHIAYDSYSYATCPDGMGGYYVTTIDGPIRYAER